MKKILHVISSPRGDASYSVKLGNAIIEKLKAANPDSVVKQVNLVESHFPHLEESHITSFFTPSEKKTQANVEAARYSDEAIREIVEADILVIGAPNYNFNIHSALKAWFDHIVRSGVTFRYDEKGPEGLIKGKKAYVVIASGGVYSEGPMQSSDFIAPYLKTILAFIGITDIQIVRVEGTAIPGIRDSALEKGIDSVRI